MVPSGYQGMINKEIFMETSAWMGDSGHQDINGAEFCSRYKPHTRCNACQGMGTHLSATTSHPTQRSPNRAAFSPLQSLHPW